MNDVVIFGAGKLFIRFMMLKERYWPELNICCVCDNDTKLDGYSVFGIPVFASKRIAEIIERYETKTILIVASREAANSIFEQLHSLDLQVVVYGLNEEKIYTMLKNINLQGGGQERRYQIRKFIHTQDPSYLTIHRM